MATLTVLQYITNALFVILAGVSFLRWRRERGRAEAWLAATFGALAGVVLAGVLLEITIAGEPPAWAGKLLIGVVILFPYLLFRFTASLERAARRTEVAAGVLAGTTVAWTLLLPSFPAEGQPRPSWLSAYLVGFVTQWTVISMIVAVKLWRAGRGQPTAARQRMRGLSLAATGLSVVIVVSGVAPSSPEAPGALAVATQLLTLASTLLFYLAFAPPATLRNAWRHQEQETLRLAMSELKTANRVEDVAAVMLPHVMSMVGGRGAALVDESGRPIGVRGETPGGLERPELEQPGLVRQPLATGSLLVWASPYAPVFGRQELELLQALGGLTELALEQVRTAERDSELAAVVDASGDAIVSTGLDGVIRSWNPAAETTYGRSAGEVVGQPLSIVLPPDRSEELDELQRRAAQGERVHLETQHVRANGDVVDVALTAAPLRNRADAVVGVSVVAHDVTARKRVEEQFRGLLESAPDAMVIVDPEGRITLVNRQTEQLFGYRREELLGQPVEVLVPARFRAGHSRHRGGYVAEPGVRPMGAGVQLNAQRKDGSEFPVEISLSPLETDRGTLVSAAVRDITDRRRAEAALEEAKLTAEQANQAKSEYLSRMSHELRTPLNAILGFAQLLELDELRDDQQESLGHILSAARHLLALINEVLDIAAIEAGRLPLSLEPVALADVVGETVSLIRPLADQHNVLLVGDTTELCDQHVLADRQRLKQVLLNLLSNAVKYNREGGSVRILCEPAPGERIRIKVADNGPGISSEALERLFVPFERLTAEFSGVEGTGLGLPLSQRLAQAMGGTLELTTAIDQGSTFWVELAAAERPVDAPPDDGSQDAPAGQDGQEPVATQITVLYIEDNLSNLQLVDRVVSRRGGVTLISAMRPMLGLDLAREHDPDLVLLDLHLPDIPGEEVLRRLRSDPRTAGIPVVILSADARPSLIKRLLGAGARAFLTKPLDVAELLGLLDQVAEERQAFAAGVQKPTS
ncbi:MAG TPA: PAS domain S-box protein [Actinomycetota bacterium]|nr:PAS domain S-box protein [Actinomycetota bacterium]